MEQLTELFIAGEEVILNAYDGSWVFGLSCQPARTIGKMQQGIIASVGSLVPGKKLDWAQRTAIPNVDVVKCGEE